MTRETPTIYVCITCKRRTQDVRRIATASRAPARCSQTPPNAPPTARK